MIILSRLISRLPDRYRIPILRARHAARIRKGTFVSSEPEFQMLDTIVQEGDWVIDIGANVGLYAIRLSTLVGETGRVFAFEPVPASFEELTANVAHVHYSNVTLFNAAISDGSGESAITVPMGSNGAILAWATFESHSVPGAVLEPNHVGVYLMPLDALTFPHPIKLIKLDVEGHELAALKGMVRTLSEHLPILIVETAQNAVVDYLSALGYAGEKSSGSANYVFRRR